MTSGLGDVALSTPNASTILAGQIRPTNCPSRTEVLGPELHNASPSARYATRHDATRHDARWHHAHSILTDLAKQGPACLILDEFQASADLSPRLPALLKALSDEHPTVSLVLAGSRRHLMESLVLAKGAPLTTWLSVPPWVLSTR
jgi:hypothetical protein